MRSEAKRSEARRVRMRVSFTRFENLCEFVRVFKRVLRVYTILYICSHKQEFDMFRLIIHLQTCSIQLLVF